MENCPDKNYNSLLMSGKIKSLLKLAEATANNSVSHAERAFETATQAESFFHKNKEKLFRIEEWRANAALSDYALFDGSGRVSHEKVVSKGDFIRLKLTGSGKYDWIKVIEIFEAADELILTVKPTFDPTDASADRKGSVSHFFTDESTNNFCLQHRDRFVCFYVIGLNEKTNTSETKNALETVRNFAAANIGYYLGIQKGEWTTFCRNFLEIEDTEKMKD